MNIFRFFLRQQDFVIECTKNTFSLVLTSLIISLLIWIPLGIIITKNKVIAKTILNIANIIFCIPSLALFSIMVTIPFLGIGRKSALLALVLYSMMPMIRSVYFGLLDVDKNIIEAARGMGMNSKRLFIEVKLPLAARSIFSGVRVSVIMLIGLSTISTYIGEKNIGRIISSGLARQDIEMILAGTILISIISLIADFILEVMEKKVIREY